MDDRRSAWWWRWFFVGFFVAWGLLLLWGHVVRPAIGGTIGLWTDDDDTRPVACPSTTTTLPPAMPGGSMLCTLTVDDIRHVLYRFRLVGPCRQSRHGEHCKRTYFKLIDP